MTSITLDIMFITAPVDLGATIHAAAAAGYMYTTLCGRSYNHDVPIFKFQEGGKELKDVCGDCLERMEELGMPIAGHAVNELGMIVSVPDLLRAVQHLFEAARHIRGYGMMCPVCGGTQADGDEGCKMCFPIFQIIQDADKIDAMANAMLLIEDPFDGIR